MSKPALLSEYLPATGQMEQELVLLHGWGSTLEVWRPMLTELRSWANVTLIDLPGCSGSTLSISPDSREDLGRAILAVAPARAVYIGWSLGGQLAASLTADYEERVIALVTVCSNPQFVASADWPGMAAQDFASFYQAVTTDSVAALKRFDVLQTRGSPRQRSLMKELVAGRQSCNSQQLQEGLQLLEALNLRAPLAQLKQPQLHCFADNDALVPAGVSAALAAVLEDSAGAQTLTLPEASHAAILEVPQIVAGAIHDFLQTVDIVGGHLLKPEQDRLGGRCEAQLMRSEVPTSAVAKIDVANSFSRAAAHYDSAAQLQRDVGTRLLEQLSETRDAPELILDMGCGTGYFIPQLQRKFPAASLLGLDLAVGMVDFARSKNPQVGGWLVGDAESLPLASNSVDLIFSSLAIQWCFSPRALFAEIARVLKPGGRCVFTSLGPDTLKELRSSWAAVDGHQHVNDFLAGEVLEQAAVEIPGVTLRLHPKQFQMQYDRVRELLTELKTLGAHNMNTARQPGLTGRKALQGMLAAYESWRYKGKLPATYEVLFGVLEKA